MVYRTKIIVIEKIYEDYEQDAIQILNPIRSPL